MRRRYFVHASGQFDDETAYVMYRGHQAYLVTCERTDDRELRSDAQRADEGVWRELTAAQAARILHRKPLQPCVVSVPVKAPIEPVGGLRGGLENTAQPVPSQRD